MGRLREEMGRLEGTEGERLTWRRGRLRGGETEREMRTGEIEAERKEGRLRAGTA